MSRLGPSINHPVFIINNGKVSASGNIQYLLDQTGERMDVPNNCYNSMFYDCSSLTTAPELPATTLTSYCYDNMFSNCTNITSVTMKNDVNPYDSSKYGTLGSNITINYV